MPLTSSPLDGGKLNYPQVSQFVTLDILPVMGAISEHNSYSSSSFHRVDAISANTTFIHKKLMLFTLSRYEISALVNRQMHLPESRTGSPSSAMPLRLFAYRAVRSWPHGSRRVCAKEAKIQPSGYLAMNIISGQHRSGGGARGKRTGIGVILPVG